MKNKINNYGGIEEDLSLKAIVISFILSVMVGLGQFFLLMHLFV